MTYIKILLIKKKSAIPVISCDFCMKLFYN
jgi:hypothetical protein